MPPSDLSPGDRERAIVLRYHAVTPGGDVDYAAPEICMPVDAFRLQMAFVRRAYRVVALDELVEAIRRDGALPPGAIAVTFDDGYADNHTLAAPILRALGVPATVYVATGSIDDRAPFGGFRQSGLGRELGVEGLREYTEPHTITFPG